MWLHPSCCRLQAEWFRISPLQALTSELIQLVRRFDGLNLLRFEDDPEKRGAWLAARDVVWPYLK
jgi:hypothetical protein